MVFDAARVAHAAGGDNDLRIRVVVDRPGILRGDRRLQPVESDGIDSFGQEPLCLIVKITVHSLTEYVRRLDRQGRIDINLKPIMSVDHVLLLDLADEVEHLLRAPDREGRDDDISALIEGALDDLCESGHVVIVRRLLMFPVAVCGLHDDIVRFLRIGRIRDQRLVLVSDIPGEYHFFRDISLRDRHFDGA